jgi:hypothetical protein
LSLPNCENDASSANKLAGKSVYNAPETIAKIHDVMIGEASGKLAYSVKSSEGFLGIGEEYHPGPWSRSRDMGDLAHEFVRMLRRKDIGS